MSQLADLEDAVQNVPVTDKERGKLFFDILQALNWEIDSVDSPASAEVYLAGKEE